MFYLKMFEFKKSNTTRHVASLVANITCLLTEFLEFVNFYPNNEIFYLVLEYD